MANYQYPNLAIVEESELGSYGGDMFEIALIAKIPPVAAEIIDHQSMRDAIHQQLEVNLAIEDISKYGDDYYIKTHSPQATAHMLSKTLLKISSYTVILIPWSPYYNAITVLRCTQINRRWLTNSSIVLPREDLTLEISGIPPHLCCDFAIHRLLDGVCTIQAISFRSATLTYSVDLHGSQSLICQAAYIALGRSTGHGNLLNIWAVWIDTYTQEMLRPPSLPSNNCISSLHGGDTELDSEHRYEAFMYSGDDNEVTSQPRVRRVHHPDTDSSIDTPNNEEEGLDSD